MLFPAKKNNIKQHPSPLASPQTRAWIGKSSTHQRTLLPSFPAEKNDVNQSPDPHPSPDYVNSFNVSEIKDASPAYAS